MSDLHLVFVRAKEILLTQGWYCGDARGPDGEPCIIIACCDAYDEIYGVDILRVVEDHRGVHDVLSWVMGVPENRVAAWNDNPTRTFEEVIAVLDEVILSTAPVVELVGSS